MRDTFTHAGLRDLTDLQSVPAFNSVLPGLGADKRPVSLEMEWTPGLAKGTGQITLTESWGKRVVHTRQTVYLCYEVRHAHTRAVRIVKAEDTPGSDAEFKSGIVVAGDPLNPEHVGENPSCECRGFLRWNDQIVTCKHVRAINRVVVEAAEIGRRSLALPNETGEVPNDDPQGSFAPSDLSPMDDLPF